MSDARATAMADSEDFDFVGWEICPNTENCMIVEVKGRNAGWVYRYVVLGERCKLIATSDVRPLDQTGGVLSQPRARLESARQLSGQPRVDTQVVDRPVVGQPVVTIGGNGGKTADTCFGGYMVVMRSRQHNSYLSDNLGYSARFEQIYQAVVDDRWTAFMTNVIGAWQTPVSGTGMTETGKSYSWTDGSGNVLEENADVSQWIASSGGTHGVTAQQLCDAKFKQKTGALNTAVELGGSLCAIIPLPTSITVGGSGTLAGAPGGAGGLITLNGSATKTFDYCATNRNIGLSAASWAASTEYLDCLQNPGRYFPAQFPPVPEELDLAGIEGFEARNPEEITITGSCPISKKESVDEDMGGGTVCTTTVNYVCSRQGDTCTCNQSGKQATVCVGDV